MTAFVLLLDRSEEEKIALVSGERFIDPRYVPITEEIKDRKIDPTYASYLIQCHEVASAQRDKALDQGLMVGPYRKPDPKRWEELSKIA